MSSSVVINVCSNEFVESIQCNTAENDLHPASSLLIGESFMAERFVSSPVIITLNFRKDLSVNTWKLLAIDVGLRIGKHHSNMLEIYAGKAQDTDQPGSSNQMEILNKIGSGKFPESIDNARFINRNYLAEKDGELSNFNGKTIFMGNYSQRLHMEKLAIKVLFAHHIRLLSFLKVWMKIPDSVLKKLPTHFDSSSFNQRSEFSDSSLKFSALSHVKTESSTNHQSSTQEMDIPEQFIDPLTQHIMVLPVVLPCGKTIDRFTLDRYLEEEAKLGHQPNDPFTGIPFTTHLPLPNTSLKERIDAFWLQYPDLATEHKVGRTIGGTKYTVFSKHSRLKERKRASEGTQEIPEKVQEKESPASKKIRNLPPSYDDTQSFCASSKEESGRNCTIDNVLHNKPSFL